MDKEAAKSAIRAELSRRITFSGGPEVLRRFIRATPDIAEAALRELVAEGFLKETALRVGRLYSFPPSTKPSHLYLAEQLAKMEEEAATRPARPARAAPSEHRHVRPGADRPEAPAGEGEPPRSEAVSAAAESAPPAPSASFTGPVRAKKKSELAAEGPAASTTRAMGPATSPPERVAALPTGDAGSSAGLLTGDAGSSAGLLTGDAGQETGATVFTGPVRAKKRSEITPEELAVAQVRPGASPQAPAPPSEAPAPSTAPGAFTGPLRARKKSETPPEEPAGESVP